MSESSFVSVEELKNYYDSSEIDATIEELVEFIQAYEITSVTVELYNIPLLLEDFIEESRKVITIAEEMLTYKEALLLTDLQPIEKVEYLAIYEYSKGRLQQVYWDKSMAEFTLTKCVVESEEEPVTIQKNIDDHLILEWIRPFCADNWPRLIQGTIEGHKLPYTYLLAIRYSDNNIAQYYIHGEYEINVPDDMQQHMDALADFFK